jgi:hypothetical protein
MNILRILAIVLALGATLAADNWPHWRGPSASGVTGEQNLPERWSKTENIAWKAPLDGLGISSPIVWSNRVFVTSQRGNGVVQQGPRLMQAGNAAEAGPGRRTSTPRTDPSRSTGGMAARRRSAATR